MSIIAKTKNNVYSVFCIFVWIQKKLLKRVQNMLYTSLTITNNYVTGRQNYA